MTLFQSDQLPVASKRAAKDSCMSDVDGSCWRSWAPTNGDMINDRISPRYDGNRVESHLSCGAATFFVGVWAYNQTPPRLFLGVQSLLNIVFSTRLRKSFADNPSWLGSVKKHPLYLTKFISYQDFIQPFSISQCQSKYAKIRKKSWSLWSVPCLKSP